MFDTISCRSFHTHFLFGSLQQPSEEAGERYDYAFLNSPIYNCWVSVSTRSTPEAEQIEDQNLYDFCMMNVQGNLSDQLGVRQPGDVGNTLLGVWLAVIGTYLSVFVW